MTPENLAHGLRRLADYGPPALGQSDRDLLKAAAEAITPPPPPFQMLADLVALLADPAETKRRLQGLVTATADHAATIKAAGDASVALDGRRAEFETELAEHRRAIETERGTHAADLHRRTRAVEGQEIEAAELLAKAKADAAAAAELKADLEQRMSQIAAVAHGPKKAAAA
jgi:hypothetical protein